MGTGLAVRSSTWSSIASGFNASERKSLEEAIPLLNRLAALL